MNEIDWKNQYRLLEETLAHIFISLETTMPSNSDSNKSVGLTIERMIAKVSSGYATVIVSASGPAAHFAFYVYANDARDHTVPYSESNTHTFSVKPGTRYRVRGFARNPLSDDKKPVEATARFEG